MNIGLTYGAFFPKLEEQANKQGYTLGDKADHFQHLRECVISLGMAGILTNYQADKCLQRLHKKVVNELQPIASECN